MKFFEELKRRNVFKETLAYLVVSWLLIQVATSILPIFNAPDWVLKSLTFFLAMGLPVWVFFSWAYQVTPEGLKKTGSKAHDQTIASATNKRLNIIILITLFIAIAVSFLNKTGPEPPSIVVENTKLISENTIAVLPFSDYSPGKDQAWFTDGMTDALITELSKISSLIVRPRTSVMQYKGATKTIHEIASELNVKHVIEGSAVKLKDSIRITARLISATDQNLWANNYDAEMKDVLLLHHTIARAITKEINIAISPADSARFKVPLLVNPGALEADLKGVKLAEESSTIEQLKEAVSYFKRAIQIDSTYADAYAHLSAAYSDYPYFCENTPMEALKLSEIPNKKALVFNPELPMAYLNKFHSLYFVQWNWNEALDILSKAESLARNDLNVLRYFVYYYVLSGKFSKAFEAIEKIGQISPNEPMFWTGKLFVQFHSRDLEGAIGTAEQGLKLFPSDNHLKELKMWSLSLSGRHKEAVEVARNMMADESRLNPTHRGEIGSVFARAGLRNEALQQLEIIQNLQLNYIDPVSLGLLYLGLGDHDMAMEYFEKGYEIHSGWMPFLKRAPPFDAIRGDERFQKLIQDLKFP
ncbi:hypothetical protein [Lutimonas vermicola]|uniref:FlgO domain-containing protein n=1 Tax=Lutimonas vermicola TaxID=414288 RepID=A0ABU9KX87_9FLAO